MKHFAIILSLVFLTTIAYTQTKPPSPSKSSLDRGKILYTQHCLVCHQADGSGVQNLNPPLIKTKWVLGDKTILISIILKGLDESIEVDGEEYNNTMPPLPYLSDQEIADVLSYVRNSFANKAEFVSAEEVKAARKLQ